MVCRGNGYKNIGIVRIADNKDGAAGWIVSENPGNDAIAQSNDPLAEAESPIARQGMTIPLVASDHTAQHNYRVEIGKREVADSNGGQRSSVLAVR